jgi:hypothetical protein
MKNRSCFDRAESLLEGKSYLLRLSPTRKRIPLFCQVKFISFTSCPAVVVVQDTRLRQIRCGRDNLYRFPQQE